ncbi:cytochrome P450 [Micromonospora tulbaghiae]|uniref:Cytochrome P450 n=1 Tax=Micromonospora tulbaghiae TaxID=479978 RepID=A0ABY0KHG4_9ACTN|nr:cytochrome P450 [Micromonospora tulbaghiae]MDX5459245.1 cytochrome P450 [Micromonospora tulbaghiae]SCE73548.1 Cytochrome P450 [Micromonospora tulbaghiae]
MSAPDVSTERPALPFPFPITSSLEPSPEYARLREEQPLARVKLPSGDEAWIATRYEDVRKVFSDLRFSRAAASRPGAPQLMPGIEGDPNSVVSKDPPDHTRMRKLVAPAFTSRRMETMREEVRRTVTELLDAMEQAGPPADLVASLTSPLPIIVICDLLGVPAADRDRFRGWSNAMFATSPEGMKDAMAARNALIGYLAAMVEARRSAPTDDLLGVLINYRDQEDRLTEPELISFAGGLIVAGYETTANRFANAVLMLMRHSEQRAMLQADDSLLPGAVEEALRYIPGGAAGGLMRVALEDVELGGVTIRAGEGVIAITNSANRDPSVFPDPDRFDITRTPGPHTTFGHGIHHCVGAQLARIELQVGLGELLRRFPKLELAVPEEELPWRKNVVIHSLTGMPVRW